MKMHSAANQTKAMLTACPATYSPARSSAKIEINVETLTRLLARGQMKVCELHCLDDASKQLLRSLCLQTCLQACHYSDS